MDTELDNYLLRDQKIFSNYDLFWFVTGCKIYAYDHTVSHPEKIDKNIRFFKTGLGFGENLKSLKQLMEENNHNQIDYLKVFDV